MYKFLNIGLVWFGLVFWDKKIENQIDEVGFQNSQIESIWSILVGKLTIMQNFHKRRCFKKKEKKT